MVENEGSIGSDLSSPDNSVVVIHSDARGADPPIIVEEDRSEKIGTLVLSDRKEDAVQKRPVGGKKENASSKILELFGKLISACDNASSRTFTKEVLSEASSTVSNKVRVLNLPLVGLLVGLSIGFFIGAFTASSWKETKQIRLKGKLAEARAFLTLVQSGKFDDSSMLSQLKDPQSWVSWQAFVPNEVESTDEGRWSTDGVVDAYHFERVGGYLRAAMDDIAFAYRDRLNSALSRIRTTSEGREGNDYAWFLFAEVPDDFLLLFSFLMIPNDSTLVQKALVSANEKEEILEMIFGALHFIPRALKDFCDKTRSVFETRQWSEMERILSLWKDSTKLRMTMQEFATSDHPGVSVPGHRFLLKLVQSAIADLPTYEALIDSSIEAVGEVKDKVMNLDLPHWSSRYYYSMELRDDYRREMKEVLDSASGAKLIESHLEDRGEASYNIFGEALEQCVDDVAKKFDLS